MIASLRGTVLTIGLDHAVIECAGVGYKFLATPVTLGSLRSGEEATVLTSMVVKEDSMTLYGFGNDEDREMFHVLQSVSGLGPKLAVAALSVMGAGQLAAAISSGDAKTLQSIPGVGKRMAERLALELKDKVSVFAPQAGAGEVTTGTSAVANAPVVEQVVEALVGLGFSDKAARPVVESIVETDPAAETSTVLRGALAQLGRKK
ncbi:Holliday junction branch migration protein RuvA [Corynebacterium sp. HMSC076D02]|uniref:Holliday junction branch migration protein RuvA n=1 Tax=Corynebacterium sp. HMSC076D02 TaxID=1739439 RepID=UPI0008A6412C|nr:Holliday junction branch migration protein RuvA [Corynebacterium sp. HMSC076D02]OFQ49470.1 Holliday junction ATP-dependent DNA helicase RuvA [Corynebacterium sp. HMSC076D02]